MGFVSTRTESIHPACTISCSVYFQIYHCNIIARRQNFTWLLSHYLRLHSFVTDFESICEASRNGNALSHTIMIFRGIKKNWNFVNSSMEFRDRINSLSIIDNRDNWFGLQTIRSSNDLLGQIKYGVWSTTVADNTPLQGDWIEINMKKWEEKMEKNYHSPDNIEFQTIWWKRGW